MTSGPTITDTTLIIPSKNKCIYCGRDDVPLTNEHIIPYFIDGVYVIKKASCKSCADITKKFEQDVARDLWGDARISYNAPTRRKKDRREHTHKNIVHPSFPGETFTVPYSEYAPPIVFYKMCPAGFLSGLPEEANLSSLWDMMYLLDEKRATEFEKKYPGRHAGMFKSVPVSFAKMIAKIGYCYSLKSFNLEDFNPICLPYILGQKEHISYVVGGMHEIVQPFSAVRNSLRIFLVKTEAILLIICEVRLFSSNATPSYHVVVGEVAGEQKIRTLLQKFNRNIDMLPEIRRENLSLHILDLHRILPEQK